MDSFMQPDHHTPPPPPNPARLQTSPLFIIPKSRRTSGPSHTGWSLAQGRPPPQEEVKVGGVESILHFQFGVDSVFQAVSQSAQLVVLFIFVSPPSPTLWCSRRHTLSPTHGTPCLHPAGCTCAPGVEPHEARVAAVESWKSWSCLIRRYNGGQHEDGRVEGGVAVHTCAQARMYRPV